MAGGTITIAEQSENPSAPAVGKLRLFAKAGVWFAKNALGVVTPLGALVGYGEIHVHDSATAQSIPTGAGYTLLTNWTDNGASSGTTPDATTDKRITVANAGVYRVEYNCSMLSGTNNVIFYASAFKNGSTELDNLHWSRKIGTGADVGSASFGGLVSLAAGDYVDVRVRHDQAGSIDFTQQYANFNLYRVG
jgi:hypothetical protein